MRIKLASPLTIDAVAKAIGSASKGAKKELNYIATSSVEADEDTLFFALDGRHTSGEEFVVSLAKRGIYSVSRKSGDYILTHQNPRAALLSLASYYKASLSSLQKTITITGSVGKTTTKELLLAILSSKWKTHATVGNLNSDIGMPLSILSAPKESEMMILEIGMNHSGEIRPLSECAEADLGIITNVGHAHIGNLGSLEGIAKEKMELCAHNPNMPVIIAKNQPLLAPLKNKIEIGKHIFFTTEPLDKEKKLCKILYNGLADSIEIPSLAGEIEECLFLAITAALTLGMTPKEIEQGILSAPSLDHRRKISSISGRRIIDDTYNASPESMYAGLRYLMMCKGKRRHAVLGDMMELGEHSVKLHTALGEQLAALSPDFIYLLGNDVCHTKYALEQSGYPADRIFYFPDASCYEGLVCALSKNLSRGDVCLLKASHAIRLWRVIEGLCEVYGE